MSTIAYAALSTLREKGARGKTTTSMSKYVDVLAALVPAEVLGLHAVILSVTTEITDEATRIEHPTTLLWAYFGLILLSIGLYVVYRLQEKKWSRLDWIRMLIPPLAFVAWTMIQRATAFDALGWEAGEAPRTVIALFLSVILGVLTKCLADKADEMPTK
ncbi:hypothetical protein JXO59_11060 [candidate division KSB1 bacterium]|nr:hypothetical protein [candidate division KSB1 bacterium]